MIRKVSHPQLKIDLIVLTVHRSAELADMAEMVHLGHRRALRCNWKSHGLWYIGYLTHRSGVI